jgi:hypothetical protein
MNAIQEGADAIWLITTHHSTGAVRKVGRPVNSDVEAVENQFLSRVEDKNGAEFSAPFLFC